MTKITLITVKTYGLINYSCVFINSLKDNFPHKSINFINKAILTKAKGIKAYMISPIYDDHIKSRMLAKVKMIRYVNYHDLLYKVFNRLMNFLAFLAY